MINEHENDIQKKTMVSRLHPSTESKDRRHIKTLILASVLVVLPQIYGAFQISHYFFHHAIDQLVIGLPPTRRLVSSREEKISHERYAFPPIVQKPVNDSFGACLMLKEDNELLYEWLAYHYTTLPLRFLFVASDIGNLQNPEEVLMRWKTANTDLEFWVQNASEFVHRHGHQYGTVQTIKDAHHAFVNSKCGAVFSTELCRHPY